MENLPQEPISIQTEPSASPPEQFQQPSQDKWWKIGFLATLLLFLATAGAFGFHILKTRQKESPQPTRFPAPVPTLTPVPTPTPTLPVISPAPTLDPTANWKTYENTKLGFSFKYPNSYFRYLKEFVDIGVYLAPSEGSGEAKGTPLTLTPEDVWLNISVSSGANLASIEAYIETMKQQGDKFYLGAQKTKLLIGGISGYKLTLDQPYGPQGVVGHQGLVKRGDVIYTIALTAYKRDALLEKEDLFNLMLSTFQFLE